MKTTLKITSLLLVVAAIGFSCTKKETKAFLNPGGATTLAATQTTIVFVQANAANAASTFTWGAADFGYAAGVTYTLQFTKTGANFATGGSTTEVNVGKLLTKAFTISELNAKLLDIVPYGSVQQVQARVKADVGSGVTPIYSNVLPMTVTLYRDIVNYVFPQALWVAGNFQGWSPATAPKIVDKFASGTTGSSYEGYINFTDPSPQFKIVKGNDWSAGDYGNCGGAGSIASPCGTNFSLTNGAGVYLLKASTSGSTWSATKITTWGIIGNATPGDWAASTPMTFNAADGSWTITVNLFGGAGKEMKFRANNDWAINFGDNNSSSSPRDNRPDYGGDNIPIALDGNYTITLDLGIAGNYSYTIRKN